MPQTHRSHFLEQSLSHMKILKISDNLAGRIFILRYFGKLLRICFSRNPRLINQFWGFPVSAPSERSAGLEIDPIGINWLATGLLGYTDCRITLLELAYVLLFANLSFCFGGMCSTNYLNKTVFYGVQNRVALNQNRWLWAPDLKKRINFPLFWGAQNHRSEPSRFWFSFLGRFWATFRSLKIEIVLCVQAFMSNYMKQREGSL